MRKQMFLLSSLQVDEYNTTLAMCDALVDAGICLSDVDVWLLTFGNALEWSQQEFDNQKMHEMIADNLGVNECPTVYLVYVAGDNATTVLEQMLTGAAQSTDCDGFAIIADIYDSVSSILNRVFLKHTEFMKHLVLCQYASVQSEDVNLTLMDTSAVDRLHQVLLSQ